mmetsp:Transcript_70059/g.111182  ORF Transcript_70059/g.111182 Transcript_70059/m.111182 type:complete len:256 (-) Transcript_70059:25-792(-)
MGCGATTQSRYEEREPQGEPELKKKKRPEGSVPLGAEFSVESCMGKRFSDPKLSGPRATGAVSDGLQSWCIAGSDGLQSLTTMPEDSPQPKASRETTPKKSVLLDTTGNGAVNIVKVDSAGSGRHDTILHDTTGDGKMNKVLKDTHGNGRVSMVLYDTTGDGKFDIIYEDTTGDGKINRTARDTTGDGNIDHLEEDTLGRGRVNRIEKDTTGDGFRDTIHIDTTGDGTLDIAIKVLSPSVVEKRLSLNQAEIPSS